MMPAVRGDSMRGLAVFISDIRNCKSKEAEIKRINKELANIRSKFKGDKTLDGYQKKKYVCKLLFIFLLGHDIDFGHMEAVNLLSSNKYTEKQIGYLFISVLISQNSDLINLINQSIKNDLLARNPVHVSLALQCVANIGSKDMVDAFADSIPKLLVSGETLDVVKQSAALCLLRLLRTDSSILPTNNSSAPDSWTNRIIHLINDQHMGVVTASVSLIEALARRRPADYKGCVPLAISRLARIVCSNYTDFQDYTYYFVPAPWLCVKLIRLLQLYPEPEDAGLKTRLSECLELIFDKASEAPKSKKVQHSNAKNAVLFEAISLITHNDSDPNLLVRACHHLGQFLTHRETNLRYLALESMVLLSTSEYCHAAIRRHQATVITALKSERDVSVRQRAVDLLYAMCDKSNAEEIVLEMLTYLETADYSIREEMVLKVAILAEKYATDYKWYVDVILNLIRLAGDYVSEEVWYRVVQIVVNRQDVQGYAAKTVFEALQSPSCHENMVKVGGYILGEYGNLIAGDPRSSPAVQFKLLHSKYHLCQATTRALLLTSYVKFVNLFPEMKATIQAVWSQDSNLRSADAELQQRASEYLNMTKFASLDVLATVLEEMPPYPERENTGLLTLLREKRSGNGVDNQSGSTKLVNGDADGTNGTERGQSAMSDTNGNDADLLGLSDVAPCSNGSGPGDSASINNASKFYCKMNGILFENDMIQIGVKTECRKHLARVALFYGNKTACPFTNFTPTISCSAEVGAVLDVQVKPIESTIDAGAQSQQMINVECVSVMSSQNMTEALSEMPDLHLSLNCIAAPAMGLNSTAQELRLKVPVTINKFVEASEMDSAAFFMRWKNLVDPSQESQVIFKATSPIDTNANRQKLTGFGLAVLNDVDPNVDNLVGAAILHTATMQVGLLLRLEPNKPAQMYRLTMRASQGDVARHMTRVLSQLF